MATWVCSARRAWRWILRGSVLCAGWSSAVSWSTRPPGLLVVRSRKRRARPFLWPVLPDERDRLLAVQLGDETAALQALQDGLVDQGARPDSVHYRTGGRREVERPLQPVEREIRHSFE